jgi:hypothetical protein
MNPRIRMAAGYGPVRVFISFDFDKDRDVARLLGGQVKNRSAGFDVENWSMKEAAPEALWLEEAQRRIMRSDMVMIILGRQTHRAPGVRKEVAYARRADVNKPLCQIIGYRDLVSPTRVPDGGHVYRWERDRLLSLLDEVRRRVA